MKETTQKSTTTKDMKVTKQNTTQAVATQDNGSNARTFEDFKNATLLVSVFINAFVFTAWLTLQVTDRYNAQVVSLLLG